MKRIIACALFALVPIHFAAAAGITRIANGDCIALAAAASTPAGAPATQIILARNGQYGYCPFTVAGNITIDGNGASLGLMYSLTSSQITIAKNASLTIRNLNFVSGGDPGTAGGTYVCGPFGLTCNVYTNPIITNMGSLILDSVSANGVVQGTNALVHTFGNVYLRNVTLIGSSGPYNEPMFGLDGVTSTVFVDQSTLVSGTPFSLSDSNPASNSDILSGNQITVSNSILAQASANFPPICGGGGNSAVPNILSPLNSKGGNITSDGSCNLHGTNDRVVADIGFADFGTHGGVIGTMALNPNSPAIANGLAANCEATDARGAARGTASCDSGAYEFGGGAGNLAAAGGSGVYYQSGANNGHYVSVQRLGADYVLVMWSTFDQKGTQAWLYGVGTLSGTTITVPQVAENLGGILHPGGAVTGATPTLWGSMTLNLSSCHAARLDYKSLLPLFGSGSINLQRLVFIDGLDCSE